MPVDRLGTPLASRSETSVTHPFEEMTSPYMLALAAQWPVHVLVEDLGGRPYATLRCGSNEVPSGFILALTDRAGRPYSMTLENMQSALLTHLYRFHGYLPDGSTAALGTQAAA